MRDTIDLENIGEWIAEERSKRKWSREYLAFVADVDTALIYRYEKEQARPRVDTFSKLLNAFGYELVVKEMKDA